MPVDLVQAARLDLSVHAALLGVALAMGVPLAQAQPLVPNPGLTSLLQPQRLDRSRPLISEERAAGTRSGLRQAPAAGTGPCERRVAGTAGSVAAVPAGSSLFGSGSGPGAYGRYIPGAPAPGEAAGKKPGATTAPPAERPLYGGVERPLWNTGAPSAASRSGKPAPAGAAGKDPASPTPVQPNALPPPVQDRPLWAGSGLASETAISTDPAASPGAGGLASAPCTPAPGSASGR